MSSGPTPRLYVILGSHACRTGILLLEHKGIGYRHDLRPGIEARPAGALADRVLPEPV